MALRLFGDGRVQPVIEIESPDSSDTPLTLIGAEDQAANLLEMKDNSGNIVLSVDPSGDIVADGAVFSGDVVLPLTTTVDGESIMPIGSGPDKIFYENGKSVTENYSVSANKNALSSGPINIEDGVIVTVPDGSSWSIV